MVVALKYMPNRGSVLDAMPTQANSVRTVVGREDRNDGIVPASFRYMYVVDVVVAA
jgi:hypothetical protein